MSKLPEYSDEIQDIFDAAELAHNSGNLEQAERLYWNILSTDHCHSKAYHGLGLIALQVGKNDAAKELLQTASDIESSNPQFLNNLASAYYLLGDIQEAARLYRYITTINETYTEALLNLGVLDEELGDLDEAEWAFSKAIEVGSKDDAFPFARLAYLLIRQDRHDEALHYAVAAYRLGPKDAATLKKVSTALADLQKPWSSIRTGEQLIKEDPNTPENYVLLASAYLKAGYVAEANRWARLGLQIAPQEPQIHYALAKTYEALGEKEKALEWAQKGLDLNPDNEELILVRANVFEQEGRLQEAYSLVRPLVEDRTTFKSQAVILLAVLSRRFGAQEETADFLQQVLSSRGVPNGVRMEVLFWLGHLLHDLGRYDEAFQAYSEANSLKPRRYDSDKIEAGFSALKKTYTKAFFDQAPRSEESTEQPIFIVGMPRSGTSLTEQILASHPKVFGAGEQPEIGQLSMAELIGSSRSSPYCMEEVTKEALNKGARQYLERVRGLAGGDVPRITDKMPQNFLHLGLISLLFPRAAIIHCVRHPLDTGLSNYFQNFAAHGLTYAYDLENIGHYYTLYEDLMKHWEEVLPVKIFHLEYERLVENPEPQVKQLLEFCGLEWNKACLHFHKTKRETKTASYGQVRQPLYTSSKHKWKKYEKHLSPLMQALGYNKP